MVTLQQSEPFDSWQLLGHTLAVDTLNRRRLRFWFWVLIVAAAASVWPFLGRYHILDKPVYLLQPSSSPSR